MNPLSRISSVFAWKGCSILATRLWNMTQNRIPANLGRLPGAFSATLVNVLPVISICFLYCLLTHSSHSFSLPMVMVKSWTSLHTLMCLVCVSELVISGALTSAVLFSMETLENLLVAPTSLLWSAKSPCVEIFPPFFPPLVSAWVYKMKKILQFPNPAAPSLYRATLQLMRRNQRRPSSASPTPRVLVKTPVLLRPLVLVSLQVLSGEFSLKCFRQKIDAQRNTNFLMYDHSRVVVHFTGSLSTCIPSHSCERRSRRFVTASPSPGGEGCM